MEEYFCTKCGASLNEQDGFDPEKGAWTCTECGTALYDSYMYGGELYPDVIWYCDNCNAVLNKQAGFTDHCNTWNCTECGCINIISYSEIFDTNDEYERHKNNNTPS